MPLYLLCMLVMFALLFFNAAAHSVVKTKLGISDRLTAIIIHSVHVAWISGLSLVIVLNDYAPRTHNFLTIFPTLFLCTYYVHELNIRRMTNDIKIHHVLFIAIFISTLVDKMSVVFDVFNIIEFGHLFHFVPYIMYKRGYRLPRVLAASNVATVGFFAVRIVGFLGIGLFVAWSNWGLIASYSLPRQISVFVLVGGLFLLQFWMYRDVVQSRNKVREKLEGVAEAPSALPV
jgi:hypothetical protein